MISTPYTPTDMEAVSDNPEWTEQDFAGAVPFAEAFPVIAGTIKRRGAQKAATKISTTIRLSPEVLAHFRAQGAGWQSRIDEALVDWVASHK